MANRRTSFRILPHLAKVVDDVAIVKERPHRRVQSCPCANPAEHRPFAARPPFHGRVGRLRIRQRSRLSARLCRFKFGRRSQRGAACWGNGFLPSVYQGVQFRSQGDAILFVSNPPGHDRRLQREAIDVINQLNRQHERQVGDPEIDSRIAAYEMAFRMQASARAHRPRKNRLQRSSNTVPFQERHPSPTHACGSPTRGVRRAFRQLHSPGLGPPQRRRGQSQASVSRYRSTGRGPRRRFEERGLLDDTLVIWGGEFGRTPMVENNPALGRKKGRDHHPDAFTMWFAGGGIKGGQTIGETDDLGYHVTQDPVHIHDVQATVLHLLGINHEDLTYRYQGRNFRLTDVGGVVVNKLIASICADMRIAALKNVVFQTRTICVAAP